MREWPVDHTIPSADLCAQALPDAQDLQGVCEFAHSYRGYDEMGGFDACARLANGALRKYSQDRELHNDLDALRACLFFEHRRWRHFGDELDESAREYIAALMEAIREAVCRQKDSH